MPSPKEVAAMKERLIRNAQNVKGEQDWLKLTEFVLAYGISQFNAGIEAAAQIADKNCNYESRNELIKKWPQGDYSLGMARLIEEKIRSLKKPEDAT